MGLLTGEKLNITITCYTFKQVHLVKKYFRWSHLADLGWDEVKRERTFTALISKERYQEALDFGKEHHIRIKIVNNFTERDATCRKTYFDTHKSANGKMWRCAYCGHLYKRYDVEVDHIYPVDRAQTDPELQNQLRKKGFTSINDPKNLVVACKDCNKKKSNKMGKWIIKGRLGRHESYWHIRHGLRNVAIIAVIFYWGQIWDVIETLVKTISRVFTG